jgi:hypothetical protein
MFELMPSQDMALCPGEVTLDAETCLLMYKGKFDQETGTIIEPQLLFNSNPPRPFDIPSEASEKRPAEGIGQTESRFVNGPLPYEGWRNPKHVELRYVYLRDQIIVDHEGVSCGTPGATTICLGDPDGYMRYILNHIEHLRADTVYMVHNHPTGDPTPSDADIAATSYVFSKIRQLAGHIIIDSGKYAFIVPDGTSYNVLPLRNLPADWTDPILKPSINHYLLGRTAKHPEQIAAWAKALMNDNDAPVLIYLDDRLRVRGLQRASLKSIFDKNLMAKIMPQTLIDFGVNGAVAVLPGGLSSEVLGLARRLVHSHILWAVVVNSEKGTPFGFVAETPNLDYLGGKHRSTFAPYYIK